MNAQQREQWLTAAAWEPADGIDRSEGGGRAASHE